MMKFTYEYDPKTKKTVQMPGMDYPELDILELGIAAGRLTSVIKKQLVLAYEGIDDQPNIELETRWWEKQDAIQTISDDLDKLSTLTLDLTGPDITDARKAEVQNSIDQLTNNVPSDEYIAAKKDEQAALTAERDDIENGVQFDGTTSANPPLWLKAYRGVKTTSTRPVPVGVIPKDVIKKLIAHDRDLKVRNLEDSVADLAKMNSLLMGFVSTIYKVLSATEKAAIPAAKAAVINHALQRWATTQTRGDRQLKTDGLALIDKLFDREVAIADIVDLHTK